MEYNRNNTLNISSGIKIRDIQLMVFDECHHVADYQMYRLIMQEFYFRAKVNERPRILGLTAPLIRGTNDMAEISDKVQELMSVYDANVWSPDSNSCQKFVNTPTISCEIYDNYCRKFRIWDTEDFWPKASFEENLEKWNSIQLRFKNILESIGERAAARAMSEFLEEGEPKNKIRKAKRSEAAKDSHIMHVFQVEDEYELNRKTLKRKWENFTKTIKLGDFSFSTRFLKLVEILKRECKRVSEENSDHTMKIIILAERRKTAQLLSEFLNMEKIIMHWDCIPLLSSFVISTNKMNITEMDVAVTREEQRNRLIGFNSMNYWERGMLVTTNYGSGRIYEQKEDGMVSVDFPWAKATLNVKIANVRKMAEPNQYLDLLTSTSLLEEGIDVPQCSLVIKFDEVMTVKEDIQSMGRARHKNSKYIHLICNDEAERHKEKIKQFAKFQAELFSRRGVQEKLHKNVHVKESWKPEEAVTIDKTGVFVSQHVAYHWLHEIYNRFDPETKQMLSWSYFSLAPFSRHNFVYKKKECVHGYWIASANNGLCRFYAMPENATLCLDLSAGLLLNFTQIGIAPHYEGLYETMNLINLWPVPANRLHSSICVVVSDDRMECSLYLGLAAKRTEPILNLQRVHPKAAINHDFNVNNEFNVKLTNTDKTKRTVWQCTVFLPATGKLFGRMQPQHVSARPNLSRRLARNFTSVKALKILHANNVLDDQLCVRGRSRSIDAFGRLPRVDDKVEQVIRLLPSLFQCNFDDRERRKLYLHKIFFASHSKDKSHIWGVLLSKRLDKQLELKYWPNETNSKVTIDPVTQEHGIYIPDEQEYDLLLLAHISIMDCIRVRSRGEDEISPYYSRASKFLIICPLVSNTARIDWKLVKAHAAVSEGWEMWPLASYYLKENKRPESIVGRIVRTTYYDMSYRLTGIAKDVAFKDKMGSAAVTYGEYYRTNWKLDTSKIEDTFLNAHRVSVVPFNVMNPGTIAQIPKHEVHILADLCRVMPLHWDLFESLRFVPSLLWRIEALMLVEEFQAKMERDIGVRIHYQLLFKSCTTPMANFNHDMNYNRNEFFGDSLFKYVITTKLYRAVPWWDEDDLSRMCNLINSNEYLCSRIKKLGWQGYIIGESFSRKRWEASGLRIEDNLRQQELSRKTLADFFEALICAVFLNETVAAYVVDEVNDCTNILSENRKMIIGDSYALQRVWEFVMKVLPKSSEWDVVHPLFDKPVLTRECFELERPSEQVIDHAMGLLKESIDSWDGTMVEPVPKPKRFLQTNKKLKKTIQYWWDENIGENPDIEESSDDAKSDDLLEIWNKSSDTQRSDRRAKTDSKPLEDSSDGDAAKQLHELLLKVKSKELLTWKLQAYFDQMWTDSAVKPSITTNPYSEIVNPYSEIVNPYSNITNPNDKSNPNAECLNFYIPEQQLLSKDKAGTVEEEEDAIEYALVPPKQVTEKPPMPRTIHAGLVHEVLTIECLELCSEVTQSIIIMDFKPVEACLSSKVSGGFLTNSVISKAYSNLQACSIKPLACHGCLNKGFLFMFYSRKDAEAAELGLRELFKDISFVGLLTYKDVSEHVVDFTNYDYAPNSFEIAPLISGNSQYREHLYLKEDPNPLVRWRRDTWINLNKVVTMVVNSTTNPGLSRAYLQILEPVLEIYGSSLEIFGDTEIYVRAHITPQEVEDVYECFHLLKLETYLGICPITIYDEEGLQQLSAIVFGYKFENPLYLFKAFIHSAFNITTSMNSYERLEHLGDSVLQLLVCQELFQRFPQWDEGMLSHMRNAFVCNHYLARRLVRRFHRNGFGDWTRFLVLTKPESAKSIQQYIEIFNFDVDDDFEFALEMLNTPKEEQPDCAKLNPYGATKTLGDIYEAIIGAILSDSNFQLERLWSIIEPDVRCSQPNINEFLTSIEAVGWSFPQKLGI